MNHQKVMDENLRMVANMQMEIIELRAEIERLQVENGELRTRLYAFMARKGVVFSKDEERK